MSTPDPRTLKKRIATEERLAGLAEAVRIHSGDLTDARASLYKAVRAAHTDGGLSYADIAAVVSLSRDRIIQICRG